MLSKILYGTKNVLIFYAGPTIHGFEIFDKHCHFGNEVEMTKENLDHLKRQVLDYKPTIPYYVCKMGKTTNNITRGKMVIPKTPTYKTYFRTLPVLHMMFWLNQHVLLTLLQSSDI
jgi:hypothetical protein